MDGTGVEAKLQHPLGVAVASGSGVAYVADTYNHKLKMIVQDGKKFHCTTLAGFEEKSVDASSGLQFSEPGGLTYDKDSKCLYVADTNGHAVKRVCFNTKTISVLSIGQIADQDQDTVDSAHNPTLHADVVCSAPRGKEVRLLAVPVSPLEINREAPSRWKVIKTSVDKYAKLSGSFSPGGEAVLALDDSSVGTVFLEASLYLCDSNEGTCSLKKFVVEIKINSEEGHATAPISLSVDKEAVTLSK